MPDNACNIKILHSGLIDYNIFTVGPPLHLHPLQLYRYISILIYAAFEIL